MSVNRLWPVGTPIGDQDPREWGPLAWSLLMLVAERAAADPALRPEARRLLDTLGDVLPCTACRKCFRAYIGTRPPPDEGDLGPWLVELRRSIALRQSLEPPRGPAPPPRPPPGTSDAELASVLAYMLRAAADRSEEAKVKWARVFRTFVRCLCAVVPPQPGGVVEMVLRNLAFMPRLGYDFRAFLEACTVATTINASVARGPAPTGERAAPRRVGRAPPPAAAQRLLVQQRPRLTARPAQRRGGGMHVR
jgi:hypothetical protein